MSQELFDGTQGSHGEQGPVRQTAVSPVRPTSEAISDAYLDLSGPPFSSTPANQQRVSGARPFSSPSPVPSASRSYKRTRLDDSSRSKLACGCIRMLVPTPQTPMTFWTMAPRGPRATFLDPRSGVGTSRATCNLHSRPGWTSTSRNALRMLWSVR